jgi:hypothetical protein
MRDSPETLEVDGAQLEEVLRRAEQALDERDATLIRRLFESYLYISELVEDKNTTIRRLRELFFGQRTEKTKAVMGRNDKTAADTVVSTADCQEADDAGNASRSRP